MNSVNSISRCAKLSLATLFSLSLSLTGCSDTNSQLPVFPVQGTVALKGKPLANALVALHPVDTSDPRATACRATTDVNGRFTVSTYKANDGAPVGEYKVTVECYQLKGSGSSLEPGPNILPVKYSRPTTTDLTVRVVEGTNNSPTSRRD
jgi:hypothetical protein